MPLQGIIEGPKRNSLQGGLLLYKVRCLTLGTAQERAPKEPSENSILLV